MKTLINGAASSYDAHEPTFQHSLWECWVSLMRHNTPVGRHYSHQIWAAAVKSVMNLSAGLVSATQSRAPPQLHWLSLCTAQGHGLCSEHRDRCGNYLNWWRRKKKKLQHSRSVTQAGFVWADCELDSLIPGWMWRDLSTFPLSLFSPVTIPPISPPTPWSARGSQQGKKKRMGGQRRAGGQEKYVVRLPWSE